MKHFQILPFFKKWGVHYLPSLAFAHLNQQCNNFKDPGVQCYGGKDFARERERADTIFCKMPPPKPTHTKKAFTRTKSSQKSRTTKVSAPSMAHYYNRGGGCFHGDCRILMVDGTQRRLAEVKRGDRIQCGPSSLIKSSTIKCVVRTTPPTGKMKLVSIPSQQSVLLATPFHPIKVEVDSQLKWVFPSDLAKATPISCEAVYNLLLTNGSSMIVEGIECVTLAHNLKGPVVSHPYYGSSAVYKDLVQMPGWSKGLVSLATQNIQRDPYTLKVIGIRPFPAKS